VILNCVYLIESVCIMFLIVVCFVFEWIILGILLWGERVMFSILLLCCGMNVLVVVVWVMS